MSTPLVKICGITRPQDAALAIDAGADAIGLNFFRGPRKIDYRRAMEFAIPSRIMTVGLAEYPAPDDHEFADIASVTQISTFQLYSDKYPVQAAHGISRVWMVAYIEDRASLARIAQMIQSLQWKPDALLLDARTSGQLGGTGKSFNWNWIVEARAVGELDGLPPIVLAGGLTPDNVAEAVRIVQPWAVDVSSGVEVAGKPGIKDAVKMRDFIAAAKRG